MGKRPFYGAVRVAMSGSQVSPPMGASLELLGRAETLRRIEHAKGLCQAS